MWYYSYPSTDKISGLPIYLISIGKHDLQPSMVKPEGHPHDQFFFNSKGSGILKIYGKTYPLPAGCGFMIPAGVPHEYHPDGDIWDLRWMVPCGEALSPLYRELNLSRGGVFRIKDTAALDTVQTRMHHALIHDPEHGIYTASSLVYEYILEFYRQTRLAKPADDILRDKKDIYEMHMEILRDYIEYHFMHPISIRELCELIQVSPQHLCRIFKHCTGRRPVEYILSVRIENAKKLLTNTEYNISDISYWSGFENCNYFCKIFKQTEHITPGEYRSSSRPLH